MDDDATLLRRFAEERRETDFAIIVERHLSLVFGAALRRANGDVQLAEDVAQDVFTELAGNANRLSGHPVLSGWLYVAAKRAAAKALRSAARRRKREEEAWAMHNDPSDSRDETDWVRLRASLDAAMDELPEADRDAVLLRFFENRPFGEIGQRLRLSENAARMRVARALERLERLLARRGIQSTAGALGAFLTAAAGASVPAGLSASVSAAAVAGAGVAGTATLLAFMGSTKVVVGAAAVLAIGAVGTAINEAGNLRAAQAELVLVQALEIRLAGEIAERAERSGTGEEEVSDSPGTALPDTSAQAEQKSASAGIDYQADDLELRASDPEMRTLEREMSRLRCLQSYRQFFRQQGLTEEQIAAFVAAQVRMGDACMEVVAAAKSVGQRASDPALEGVESPESGEAKVDLSSILGAQGMVALDQFVGKTTARATTDSLAALLYDSETPLTEQQGLQLTDLVAANTQPGEIHGALATLAAFDWPTVYTGAAGILSPAQLEMLQRMNERNRLCSEQAQHMTDLATAAAREPAPGQSR